MSKRRNSRRVRAETKQAPVTTMDAFSNPIARLGYGTQDLMQATQYPLTRMTQNYQLLTSLYRDNWIVQNIISTIPEDMVRKVHAAEQCGAGVCGRHATPGAEDAFAQVDIDGNVLGPAIRRCSRDYHGSWSG